MAKSSITVNFKAVGADGEELNSALDAAKHLEVYGEAKSEFFYGEDFWIKVYPEPINTVLSTLSNAGSVTVDGSGNEDIEERLTFDDSLKQSLSKLPNDPDLVTFKWYGNDPGRPDIIGKQLKFAEKQVAVCDVTYTTPFFRFKISGVNEEDDLFPMIVIINGTLPEA